MSVDEILDEPAVVVFQLSQHVLQPMTRIQLHLLFASLFLEEFIAVLVGVKSWVYGIDTFEARILRLKAAEHLVEGAVFQQQENYVFDWICGSSMCGSHSR